jgi:DNA-binding NarL/FixJ family response regulator
MLEVMSKVLIVEDEAIFRSLLRDHIETAFKAYNIVEACDGEEGWDQFRKHNPGFCIVDLRLPKLRGEMLINLMQCHHSSPRILVLTGQPIGEFPDMVKKTDKLFFIEKRASLEKLDAALKQLFNRRQVEPGDFALDTTKAAYDTNLGNLTDREKTILGMVGDGKSSESIAVLLGISLHTVRTHRRNLMQKLGIHNGALLVRYALESGLASRRS